MRKRSISVIIPNYNGKHLLQQNLITVINALEKSACAFEIIIVDDCSSDGSYQYIEQHFPSVKLLSNQTNGGFSVACNKGIFAAKYELILLLNTDIQLPLDFIEGQLKYFDQPDTFGVMSKIIGVRNNEVQDTARHITRSGFKIKTNKFFHVMDEDFWCPTAYLSGANALIDAKKLKDIGGFNEIFSPFYCEDFELGLRAWRLGWKCYYQPQCFCVHDHSSTTKNYRTRNWVKAIFFRNRLIVHAIHLDFNERTFWLLQILLTDFLVLWIGLKFYFYKSLGMFLSRQIDIKKSRKQLNLLMQTHNSDLTIKDIKLVMDEMLKGQAVIDGRGVK
ncbi:MAG: hypothetical protein JWN56_2684 [Sphingobacteriales bacterium]|nr:hypothetical protein [Sphingobacteriales bacterium]